jgi:pimeloyl-ACP methyl ester carboxylesterase
MEMEESLEAALRARIAQAAPSASTRGRRSARRRERIVFDGGTEGGAWTIDFVRSGDGGATLSRGRARDATSTVSSDARTLIDVLDGRLPGIEAFLQGKLFLRGNIAFAMELDDLLPFRERPRDPRSPRCRVAYVEGVKSFYLEAGPQQSTQQSTQRSPQQSPQQGPQQSPQQSTQQGPQQSTQQGPQQSPQQGAATSPPIILLHGLGATAASFLPMHWDLARDHRVLAVDLPGFGESDKPIRPLHAAYFARWLVGLLDQLGIDRADLIGNSMGGRVALEVGLREPKRVDRLVLLAPSLAWRRYRAAARIVRLLRPELAVMPLFVLHRLVIASLRSMFARPERVADAAMNAAADEFVRVFATPRGRIAFFHAAREIYLEDPHGTRGFWDRLPSLSRPALFIFGEKDRLVPRAFLKHVQQALPKADYELFADCGHVPQFELPERTNHRVRAFLSRGSNASDA